MADRNDVPQDGETTEALLTAAGRHMQQDKYAKRLQPVEPTGVVVPFDAMR